MNRGELRRFLSAGAEIPEAVDGYRSWAPSTWQHPVPDSTEIAQFANALARPDVWCLLALEGNKVIGHVALSPSTREDPGPPPAGTVHLWQLFVRPSWQGRGIAKQLIQAAVTEAAERGYSAAPVDTTGRRPRPTLL